jgi:DNA-binding cell septation regulator SpoVG
MATEESQFEVHIRRSERPGQVKAYADIRLFLPNGEIELIGFAIIEQSGKSPFVAFPQNRGRNKYFPVVEAKGRIREELAKAILNAHRESKSKGW